MWSEYTELQQRIGTRICSHLEHAIPEDWKVERREERWILLELMDSKVCCLNVLRTP